MEGTNLDCEQFKCCKLPHIKVWSQTKYARSHVSPTLISVRDLLHVLCLFLLQSCPVQAGSADLAFEREVLSGARASGQADVIFVGCLYPIAHTIVPQRSTQQNHEP